MRLEEFKNVSIGDYVFVWGDFDNKPKKAQVTGKRNNRYGNLLYVSGHPAGITCYDYRDAFISWKSAINTTLDGLQLKIANLRGELDKLTEEENRIKNLVLTEGENASNS